jgi:hypothetical protein
MGRLNDLNTSNKITYFGSYNVKHAWVVGSLLKDANNIGCFKTNTNDPLLVGTGAHTLRL